MQTDKTMHNFLKIIIAMALVGFILVAILVIFAIKAFASTTYPQYQGHVTDLANVLDAKTELDINNSLSSFERRTTDQIAVLTVDTTGDESIEEYGIHLADQWKIGQKGSDNGVILIFAMDDHKMRIEVGRGLEGDLTDIEAKHILDDEVKPEFKAGNYNAGVIKAATSVMIHLDPKATESARLASTSATLTTNGSDVATGFVILMVFIFIIIMIFVFIFATYDDGFGSGIGGAMLGGFAGGSIGGGSGEDDSGSSGGDSDSGGGFSGGGGSFSGGGATSSW